MKKKLLGGLLVVAILATSGIVAARVNTTEASSGSHTGQGSAFHRSGADSQQSKSTSKPFIGIAITSVPEDSDTDGALIVRVVEGSPADGKLQVDDTITAIDDESVSGSRDVVRIVREHSPGDVLVFNVVRGGTSMDVSITVGEWEESYREGRDGKRGGRSGLGNSYFGKSADSFVLSDTRYMTDDGVKTVRKAAGSVQNVNGSAGTFDLLLGDDSETMSFTIDEDTKISTDTVEGQASLSDLSADTTTIVVQVTHPDGTSNVQSIVQGEFSMMMHSILGRHGFDRMPRVGRGGSDGFSPRSFFFRWFSDDERTGNERRGRGYD